MRRPFVNTDYYIGAVKVFIGKLFHNFVKGTSNKEIMSDLGQVG